MTEPVKMLTGSENYAVVHLPGRAFPGVVMQGDSLHNLVKGLKKLSEAMRAKFGNDELLDDFDAYWSDLADVKRKYEVVLAKLSLKLPYPASHCEDRASDKASLENLLDKFLSGEDRSLAAASSIELALSEGWPGNDEVQRVVEMLAAYRPGGGDFLFNEEQITRALQQLKLIMLQR